MIYALIKFRRPRRCIGILPARDGRVRKVGQTVPQPSKTSPLTARRASGNVNERTQAIYDSAELLNELRNRIHLETSPSCVALIVSLIKGSPDRQIPTTASTALVAECTEHTNTTAAMPVLILTQGLGVVVGIS